MRRGVKGAQQVMPGASCIARATMAARSVPLRSLENHLVLAGAVPQPWPARQHSKRFASEGNRGKALLAGQDAHARLRSYQANMRPRRRFLQVSKVQWACQSEPATSWLRMRCNSVTHINHHCTSEVHLCDTHQTSCVRGAETPISHHHACYVQMCDMC